VKKKRLEQQSHVLTILRNMGTVQEASKSLEELGVEFSYPKPVKLIKYLVQVADDIEGIFLDFFAGSCTTAHAILDLNKQDNGNRKFICVQLPEKCDEKSEAFKTGYKTIADIGKERIRRVIKKIKDSENGKLPFAKTKQDLGFKVLKLQASNFKIWRGDNIKNGELLEKHLQLHLDSIKKDATEENMLFELLLKSGRNLNSTIENANDYYRINDGEIVIALSRIDEKIVDSILEDKPQIFITLDRLFKNNDQLKTNTALQMKDAGIEFKVV
jgi:adenine-specific DNA-methyltransferase